MDHAEIVTELALLGADHSDHWILGCGESVMQAAATAQDVHEVLVKAERPMLLRWPGAGGPARSG
jgi:hypothetical protein